MSDQNATPTLPVEPIYLDKAELEAVALIRRLRLTKHPDLCIIRWDGQAISFYGVGPPKRFP